MSDGASGDNQAGPGVPAGAMSRELLIVNKRGLHARASAKFVQLVERFNAEVWVTRGGETVGGTSIMGLMMLAAGPVTQLYAHEAMEAGWQGDFAGAAAVAPLAGTYFNMRKTTIYGGSNEVQRNIIAQTVLG